MSWIESPFFRSVKFRMTLVYSMLLTMAFLAVSVVFFIYSRYELYTLLDKDISAVVDRLSYEYLTGNDLPADYAALSREEAKKVFAMVRSKLPGDFQLELAFENVENEALLLVGSGASGLKIVDIQPGNESNITIRSFVQSPDRGREIAEFSKLTPEDGRQYEYFWMCGKDGQGIYGSAISGKCDEWISSIVYKGGSKVRFEIIDASRERLRVAYRVLPDGQVIAAARSLHDFDTGVERMLIVFASVAGGVFLLSLVMSYLIACRLCRGVEAVSSAADAVAGGDFSCRVKTRNSGSEIDRMMNNFNIMIGNTEKLMDELRTISDNIAHDLRTPLTRMIGRAELAVTGNMSQEEYENAFAANVEECRRMLTLINTMLDISRTESGASKLRLESFDMVKLLDQSIELFGMLADEKKLHLKCRVPEMPVQYSGDRVRIQQMLANLLDNAVKFTPEGGRVDVALQLESSSVILTVRDSGCGMNEEEVKMVFKRFYRADSSRSMPGNGLGLSLVLAIVNAHNGQIDISSQPGEGTFVRVTLPVNSTDAFMNKK